MNSVAHSAVTAVVVPMEAQWLVMRFATPPHPLAMLASSDEAMYRRISIRRRIAARLKGIARLRCGPLMPRHTRRLVDGPYRAAMERERGIARKHHIGAMRKRQHEERHDIGEEC